MSLSSRFSESDSIWNYSNPRIVQRRARIVYGRKATVFRSYNKNKKYFIIDPNGKKVHFGQMGMEDYTHSNDETRRKSYLKRSGNIKGNWKDNHYSPNHLARNLLWNA